MANDSADGGLGARIKGYRQEKGLSQAELARQAGLSAAYLSELEGGAGRRPSGRILLAIAEQLGVTVADLLGQAIRPSSASQPLPEGLAEFAKQARLPAGDVEMLAGVRWRGDPPRSAKRWQVIYDAIQSSRVFDEEP
jgi:transcriptional regulator with XRE-family HTH domain